MQSLKRARWLGAWFTLAVIALLAMHEIGRAIGDVVVHGDTTYSAGSLSGLTQFWHAATAINGWAIAECSGIPVKAWLCWLVGFDVLFVVGYGAVALAANYRWDLHNKGWIVLLVGADLAEDVLTGIAILLMPHGGGCGAPGHLVVYHVNGVLGGLMIAVTAVKWLAVVGLVLHTVWVITRPPGLHARVHVTVLALGVQRYLVIVVAVLAVMLVVPGPPVLEQGIDVERAWLLNTDLWLGVASAIWALVFMTALALALRYLASVRVAPFHAMVGAAGAPDVRTEEEPPEVTAFRAADTKTVTAWGRAFGASLKQSRFWLLAAGSVAVVIWILGLTPLVRVYWHSAIWVCVVLGAIPVLSAALAVIESPTLIDVYHEDVRKKAYQVGRALAYSVPAILAVSVCRSLVAPLMLLPHERVRCAVVLAICAVAACGYMFWRLYDNTPHLRAPGAADAQKWWRVDPQLVGARRAPGDQAAHVPGLAWSIGPAAGLTAACAAVLLIIPEHVSGFFGVLGIVGLCLILLTAFYALLQILAQLTDPPHLFRLLGIRRTPVVAVVVIIGILSTFFATGTSLHQIRKPESAAADQRPTLSASLQTWLANRSPDCAIAVPSGDAPVMHMQPLVMIAAEGGGIRAAWWTVAAMTSLTSKPCGRDSIFLTSGVSGGAVGLGVMATASDPYARMKDLAGQRAVAAATEGLLSRDLVAGAFGINVRAADGPSDDAFPDRGALIEHAWEQQAPGFDAAFPSAPGASAVPWHTVFNGTSVAYKCRVLVSDVKLTPTPTGCDDPANTVPGSYDLFDARSCDVGIRTSTASLLASRFPYVTPSGVISACGKKFSFRDQVIDGGYSENSGIETVNSMLAQLMPAIRATNSAAVQGGPDPTVIVPVVMFLHNTVVASSSDTPRTPKVPKAEPEPIVPPTNQSDSGVLGKTATLLQRSATIANDWVPDMAGDQASALRDALGTTALAARTMTVAPQQQPQIALPLGWTLSQGTRDSLDKALDAYLTCVPKDARTCKQSSAFDALLDAWGITRRFPLDGK